MCWICDKDASANLTYANAGEQAGLARLHFARMGEAAWGNDMWVSGKNFDSPSYQFGLDKLTTAFPVDGVGDFKPPVLPQLLITTDNVPGDNTTTQTVIVTPVGGAITDNDIIGTIDTIGDEDFFKVTLTAGTAYEFHLYSHNGGPNAAGLTDPYLELYAPDGTTMLVSGDGGADTVYNQANSGLDVLLVYTPTQSGTFYVNARAYSNSPATPNGDSVGDYMLAVREQDPNDPTVYHPYYQPTEPLYAIDWGTQVNKINQSARNPDGNEGTRTTASDDVDPTGNAQGTPIYTTLFDVPALAAAQGKDISGKNVITIYFAKPGDVIEGGLPPATVTAVAPQQFERDAVFTSLAEFEKVADIIYLEVQNKDHADFIYTSYQGTPGPGVSLLGAMSPPDEPNEGVAQFNSGDARWNAVDLQQGGFSFVTLIHEFGHGHGLAHPHDNGGHSGIMNGVVPEGAGVADYTTGDYDLNQGVFTMMSYEDGWQTSPHTPRNAPTTGGYGYLGGLMAFDIAAIQDKYGVNEDWATGDDTYVMKDVNAPGTYYYSIWDGGGTDAIVYGGARNSTIDLRSASLQYEYGGGGNVSFALGIYGGFTIANGVTIENATSGSGSDTLIGNAANNILNGGAGIDVMTGHGGNDFYVVDAFDDRAIEAAGQGFDIVQSSAHHSLVAGSEIEVLWAATSGLTLTGNELANDLWGSSGLDLLNGGGGNDAISGLGGNDFLDGGVGIDTMLGGAGDDFYRVDNADDRAIEVAGQGFDIVQSSAHHSLIAGSEIEVLWAATSGLTLTGNELANDLWGSSGLDLLNGGGGNDAMSGLGGNDFLDGGVGIDTMLGGAGDDFYRVDNADDRAIEVAGEGQDVVFASSSFALEAGSEVEVLWAATGGLTLAGNEFANDLWGSAGVDTLNGGGGNDAMSGLDGNDILDGGEGNDTMIGGAGADAFRFTTALGPGNVDVVSGFEVGIDRIELGQAIFGMGAGPLSPGAFRTGTSAQDADDRIIYDSTTGALYFDSDGAGGAAAVQFASLGAGLSLSASDFAVI